MTAWHVSEPEWVFAPSAGRPKAHLVKPHGARNNAILASANGWCGIDVGGGEPAPYAERCKECLKRLNDYRLHALVEPPALVTEVVTVQITRPSTSDETATSYLTRALNRKTSWGVTVVGNFGTKKSDS